MGKELKRFKEKVNIEKENNNCREREGRERER